MLRWHKNDRSIKFYTCETIQIAKPGRLGTCAHAGYFDSLPLAEFSI